MKMKRTVWSQTDFALVFCGMTTIVIGSLTLSDAVGNSRGWDSSPGIIFLGRLSENDFTIPLIVLGVATAVAWWGSSRATYRIALIEASRVLARGAHLEDISDMLEVKLPRRSWLLWRLKMWLSTFFAFSCVLLYLAAALLYRLAFRSGGTIQNTIFDVKAAPMFGCISSPAIPDGLIGAMNWFGGDARNIAWRDYNPNLEDYSEGLFNQSGWNILQGWRSPCGSFDDCPWGDENVGGWVEFGILEAPYLVAMSQHADIPDDSRLPLTVSTHPSCGQQLRICTLEPRYLPNGMFAPKQTCAWVGFAVGTYATTYDTGSNIYDSDYDGVIDISANRGAFGTLPPPDTSGSRTHTFVDGQSQMIASTGCPLILNSTTLITIAESYATNIDDHDPTDEESYGKGGDSSLLSFLAAQLSMNLDNFGPEEVKPLVDLGLLIRGRSDVYCSELLGDESTAAWRGNTTQVHESDYWPMYQYSSGALILLWGMMLLLAAYPWRHMVLNGDLSMFISLGGTIGTGPLNSTQIRLEVCETSTRVASMRLIKGTGNEKAMMKSKTPKIKFGWTYLIE